MTTYSGECVRCGRIVACHSNGIPQTHSDMDSRLCSGMNKAVRNFKTFTYPDDDSDGSTQSTKSTYRSQRDH